MSDGTNNGTAAQPATGANAPATAQPAQQFTVPSGHRLVSDDDYGKFTRYEQQVRGFQPFYEKATKLGFKSPEDFDRYAPAIDTLNKRKIDPKVLASMFEEDQPEAGGKNAQPTIDIDEIRKSARDDARMEAYKIRHEDAVANDPKIVDAAVRKFLGDGEHDDYTKAVTSSALARWMEDNRPLYPKGHPLAETALAPFSSELADKAIAHFNELKAKQKGAELAAAAKDAVSGQTRPKVPTIAGGGGPPGKPNTTDSGRRPNGLPSKAAVEAAYAAKRAGR
jgi:hypothetical protein